MGDVPLSRGALEKMKGSTKAPTLIPRPYSRPAGVGRFV